jgi:hypothetical protein
MGTYIQSDKCWHCHGGGRCGYAKKTCNDILPNGSGQQLLVHVEMAIKKQEKKFSGRN